MTHEDVASWLKSYVEAWNTYDAAAIGRLFSADAAYHYSPFELPIGTREGIVEWWQEDADVPGTFVADYVPLAVDGNTAVAHGRTRYRDVAGGPFVTEFANVFLMRFNEAGECSEFREWYMQRRPY